MSINEDLILSPNYSGRGGASIVKGIAHTTQGWDRPGGRYDAAYYFQSPSSQVSAHWTNDVGSATEVVCCVYEQYAAWTGAGLNSYSLQVEQCAYTEQSRQTWLNERYAVLLRSTANIFRYISDTHHIPLRILSDGEIQDSWTKGFGQHYQGGSMAGGHADCGKGTYPMDIVIQWALEGSTTPAPTPPATEEAQEDMPYFQVPIDGSEVDISLDGGHSSLGLWAPSSARNKRYAVQAYFHLASGKKQEIICYVDQTHEKVVVRPEEKFDAVTLKQTGDYMANLIVNVGR